MYKKTETKNMNYYTEIRSGINKKIEKIRKIRILILIKG